MGSGFWQINIGQIITAVGIVGSALVFIWRTAHLHGQQEEQLRGLAAKVDKQETKIDEHSAEIQDLASLARVSKQRLDQGERRFELLEEEMRDIHRHRLASPSAGSKHTV